MTSPLRNLLICMDDRMLGEGGTGVATYARALRATQLRISSDALLVGTSPVPTGSARRLVGALRRGSRRLLRTDGDPGRLVARDLFRTAHVHFGIHRRLLALDVEGPPGLVHWSYPVPLRIAGWANLYTVHDVIPLTDPDLTPIDAARHRRVMAEVAARAARIVTVSGAARSAIVAQLGCAPDFVVDASQPVVLPDRLPAALPAGLVADGYLLVLGSIEPRKNTARILAAYRRSGVDLPLVFAGPDGWRADDVRAEIVSTPGVVRLRDLGRDAVLALIAGARTLLMPSLAEGFGLPVAEAMAFGTPVLTADRGALAETAGGAAYLVDPHDVGAIAAGIALLATDASLRSGLVAAGRVNATRFTPAAFADRLATLYGEVASTGLAAYPPATG